MLVAARQEAEGDAGDLAVAPGPVEDVEELAAVLGVEDAETVPEVEELRRRQQDRVEGLHHQPGKLQVGLVQQQFRETAVNVLGAKQHAQLPETEEEEKANYYS